nr:hypothetical protein [Massilia sp. TS11]
MRRREGDRLMLSDAVMLGALDGSRPFTPAERAALADSPLTLRRFSHLARERRARPAANDLAWSTSQGLLRAADAGEAPLLRTDDGHWQLSFFAEGGNWQVLLKLSAKAPFAAALLAAEPMLNVRDGAGTLLLQGRLDADGEFEAAWPLAADPGLHLQQHGGIFSVSPVRD